MSEHRVRTALIVAATVAVCCFPADRRGRCTARSQRRGESRGVRGRGSGRRLLAPERRRERESVADYKPDLGCCSQQGRQLLRQRFGEPGGPATVCGLDAEQRAERRSFEPGCCPATVSVGSPEFNGCESGDSTAGRDHDNLVQPGRPAAISIGRSGHVLGQSGKPTADGLDDYDDKSGATPGNDFVQPDPAAGHVVSERRTAAHGDRL